MAAGRIASSALCRSACKRSRARRPLCMVRIMRACWRRQRSAAARSLTKRRAPRSASLAWNSAATTTGSSPVASIGGEFGFRGVLRDVVCERGDGAFVADGALLGGVFGGVWEVADEVDTDGAGEGFGDVREDVDHGLVSRLRGERAGMWELVLVTTRGSFAF